MAGEIDTISVRLDADIRTFQHQLDRARAQLSKFATGASVSAGATDAVGKAATRSIPGLGRLGNALENVATRAAGVPGIMGKVLDVFGSLAIGSGPMVLLFAGLAGAALAFRKITEEARETKKAAEDALKSVTNAWLSRQTQGDIDLINEQKDIGAQVDVAARRLERAKEARENKEYLAKLEKELLDLRVGYDRVTQLLTERRTERQQEAAERAARGEEQAANQAATAWKRAYAEIEAEAKRRLEMSPELRDIALPFTRATSFREFNATGATRRAETAGEAADRLGFFVPTIAAADNALDELKGTVKQVGKELAAFVPQGSTTPSKPGFLGGLAGNIAGMLDPRVILSNLATGFISSGINFVIDGLGKAASGLLGLGNAAQEAARQSRLAIMSLRDSITFITGTDLEKNFAQVRARIQSELENLFGGVDLSGTSNFGELIDFLKKLRDGFAKLPFMDEAIEKLNLSIDLAEALFGDLNDQLKGFADGLRNIPTGFKIALAQFNATDASSYRSPLVDRYGIDVTVRFEPSGVLKAVETWAVRKRRAGGRPDWELR